MQNHIFSSLSELPQLLLHKDSQALKMKQETYSEEAGYHSAFKAFSLLSGWNE